MQFATNGTERMRIDNSGNVGIGLTPAEKLEVFGNIKVNAANDKGFLLGGNSAILRQNSTEMGFETNGSERMRLNATGLGIGTTSPDTLLEAEGTSSLPLFLSRQQSSAGVGVGLGFRQYDSTNALHNYASIFGVIEDNTNGAEDGAVTIHTSLAGSLGERMRIDSSGNVGIGETSPSTKLHITSGAPNIRLEDSDNSSYGEIVYNTAGGGLLIRSDENTSTGTSGSNIIFETDGPERMRITSAGNVGIGTDSPATDLAIVKSTSPTLRLERSGASQLDIIASTAAAGSIIDAQSNHLVIRTSTAEYIAFETNDTERMRIDSSGNLQLGSSSNTSRGGSATKQLIKLASGQSFGLDIQASSTSAAGNIIFSDGSSGIFIQHQQNA
jgi:hypothetical protein